jgi:iron(III) transport system permease protein
LGRWTPLAALPLIVLLILALGVPIWSLARWMIEGRSTTVKVDQLVQASLGTLQLGAAGAACVTLCALPVAWLSVRAHRIGTLVPCTGGTRLVQHATRSSPPLQKLATM